MIVPKKIYLVSGFGVAPTKYPLLAFDRALAQAGIADLNHLQVSSIIPPGCEIVLEPPKFPLGALSHTVYSTITGTKGIISACLVLLTSKIPEKNGVIFEHSAHATKAKVENIALSMAKAAMSDRQIPVDKAYGQSIELKINENEVGCVVVAAVME